MTLQDIEILQCAQARQDIENNLEADPTAIALNKRIANSGVIATQVKYLQRARTKLPSYYDCRAIIPSLSLEQSSSEESARHKDYSGNLCIDLTCGLGVDTLYLSRKFGRVISIERDEVLAHIARINFERLGVKNVEVICSSAEDFIENFAGCADLIYVDPDRRGENNQKLLLLEECSPNVVAMMEVLMQKSRCVVIKNSPLFDVDEAFRIFGSQTAVDVVSLRGECKEVLIEIGEHIESPAVKVSVLGVGGAQFAKDSDLGELQIKNSCDISKSKYLLIPDVALLKARKAIEYVSRFDDLYIESNNGYAFGNYVPEGFLGRAYAIESQEVYNPKALKKRFKQAGVKNADIMKRDFPVSTSQIIKELGISEGGKTTLAFTSINGIKLVMELKKL